MIILQLDSEQLQIIIENAVRKVISEQTKRESNPLEGKDLLTITEAAEMLSLAKLTIYGLVCHSKIPCMKRGKKLYFSRKELTEWLIQGKKKTISEIQKEADNYLNKKKRK